MVFLFLFWEKTSYIVCYFYMEEKVQTAVHWCSSNFAVFTRKHLCWSLFLIKLQVWRQPSLLKRRPQHRCFSVNISCENFKNTFFIEHIHSSLYLSKTFCDDRILWTSLGTKLLFLYFLCHCLVFLHSSGVRIGITWFFRTFFIPKFLVGVIFARITMSASELFWLNR